MKCKACGHKRSKHNARGECEHLDPETGTQDCDCIGDEIDERLSAWVIHYADVDRTPEYFSGFGAEEAAHARFAQLSASWTCKLFRCIGASGLREEALSLAPGAGAGAPNATNVKAVEEMPPELQGYAEKQLNAIEASVFNGDCYSTAQGQARIRWYIARWLKELDLQEKDASLSISNV